MRDATAILNGEPPTLLTQRAASALSGRSPAAIRQLVRQGVLRGQIPNGYENRQVIERASLEALMHRKVTFHAWLEVEQREFDRQRDVALFVPGTESATVDQQHRRTRRAGRFARTHDVHSLASADSGDVTDAGRREPHKGAETSHRE